MTPLLTIVIPVYNAEKYIEECLKSIFNTPELSEICEVIAVDDCSTDGSACLLLEYGKRYPNVMRYIRLERNSGVALARNKGLCEARGTYIWFVDADDEIISEELGKLLSLLKKGVEDLIAFNFVASGGVSMQRFVLPSSPLMSGRELFTRYRIFSAPWNKVFRRRLLLEHGLFFKPDILPEDQEWLTRCYWYVQKARSISSVLYHYRNHDNSLSLSRDCRNCLVYIRSYVSIIEDQIMMIRRHESPDFWNKICFYLFAGMNAKLHFALVNQLVDREEYDKNVRWQQRKIREVLQKLPILFNKEYFLMVLLAFCPRLYTWGRNEFRRRFSDLRNIVKARKKKVG